MDITLKVQPEVLTSKTNEIASERTTISSLMDQAKAEITSLNGVWESPAAEEYQSRFRQIYDDIESVIGVVSEHISDLYEIANIYTTAEKAAQSQAESLPVDGVFKY